MTNRCFKCCFPLNQRDAWYGLHEACFVEWFSKLADFQDIASQPQPTEQAKYKIINSSFFHGKFRKYSAVLGETHYILKIEESEYPELPATEYLCNQIFKSLNINVTPFYLINFTDDKNCFVTKNFMGSQLESSLVHIYHFFEEKMLYDCETLLKIIGEKTGRLTAQEDFVYLTLADSLIGNNDRHGRNLALINSSKGYVLAPIYDNPSYLGVEIEALLKADHQPKGAIWTKATQEPSMKDYVKEWERLGFINTINRFRKAVSLVSIQQLIANSFLSQKRQEALLRIVTKRVAELCQN